MKKHISKLGVKIIVIVHLYKIPFSNKLFGWIITFFTSFLQFILCMILDAELRVYDRLIVILINS